MRPAVWIAGLLAVSAAFAQPPERSPAPAQAQLLGDSVDTPRDEPVLKEELAAIEERSGAEAAEVIPTLSELGDLYYSRFRLNDAIAVWQRLLRLVELHAGAQSLDTARALHNLGALQMSAGDPRAAVPLLERALALREQHLGPEHADVAYTLTNLGGIYRLQARYAEARIALERALWMRERLLGAEHPFVAWTATGLGNVYRDVGAHDQALAMYQRALAIQERQSSSLHGSRARLMAESIGLAALMQRLLGDIAGARANLERGLEMTRDIGDEARNVRSWTYAAYGRLLTAQGDYSGALAALQQSLVIAESYDGPAQGAVADRLRGLAELHLAVGDSNGADRLATRALALDEKRLGAANPAIAAHLQLLARARSAQGDHAGGLALAERALAIRRALPGGPRHDLAAAAALAAELLLRRKNLLGAEALLDEAAGAVRQQWGDQHGAMGPLELLGASLALAQRRPEEATARCLRGWPLALRASEPELQWRLQQCLADAAEARGSSALAIFWRKQAVNGVQALRGALVASTAELRADFLAQRRRVYTRLVDALVANGRLPEAQQILTMLKEDELDGFAGRPLRGSAGTTRASYVGAAEIDAAARIDALATSLKETGRRLGRLDVRERLGLEAEAGQERSTVEALWRQGVADWQTFSAALEDRFQDPAAAGSATAESSWVLDPTLRPMLANLGPRTALLHYVMAQQRLVIIVTTAKSGQSALHVDVTASELAHEVMALRHAVQTRGAWQARARSLHRRLLAPVERQLAREGIERLLLSLDGTLRYLPFALLHDGRRFAVEHYELSLFTAAARPTLLAASRPSWTMTGLGTTRAVSGFEALPGVQAEFAALQSVPVPGPVYLDDAFTAQRLRQALASGAPVLHIATHFRFEPGALSDSFLLLGDGSRLSMRQIREQALSFAGTELLTLSSCDTAVSAAAEAEGGEVESFAALAQLQGARAVLASLWPVADDSTGALMRALYAERQKRGQGVAAALRKAQTTLIRGPSRTRHPYFWAAFVLLGNPL